jgi:hypothetical protein
MRNYEFKYSNSISKIIDCPPFSYSEITQLAYRFIHGNQLPKSFLPNRLLQPNRPLGSASVECMAWGLSMFSTKENAVQKYQRLLKSNPHFGKLAGESLATIDLKDTEGVASDEDKFGHFTYHEYICADLLLNITAIEPLI